MDNLPDDVLVSVLHFASFHPRDVFCSYPATCRRWNDILSATWTAIASIDNTAVPVVVRDASSAAAYTGSGARSTGYDIDGEATAEIWRDLVRLHHPSVMEGLVSHQSTTSNADYPDESSYLRIIRRKTSGGTYEEEDGKLPASTTMRTKSVGASELCWREIFRTLERNARLRPTFKRDEQQLDILFRPWLFDHSGGRGPSDEEEYDEFDQCGVALDYTPPQLDSYQFFVTIAYERGGGDTTSKEPAYFAFAANAQFRTCKYNIGDDTDVATSEAEVIELELVEADDGILLLAATKVVVEVCRNGVAGQCIGDQGGKATLFQWICSTSSAPRQELGSCRFYDYAKFGALNHCVRARNPIRNLQSNDGFTCCVPSARVDVGASFLSRQRGNGNINKIILKMEWADPALRKHLAMPRADVLKLLDKGLDYNGDCGSPHHFKDSYRVVLNSGRMATALSSFLNPIPPRPIDSYSFLVQYSLVTEDEDATAAVVPFALSRDKRIISAVYSYHRATSVFVETDDCSPCGSKLVFDVPSHCHDILPPSLDNWERTRGSSNGEFTSMAVYVIQNDTGLQAKLYEGDAWDIDEDHGHSPRRYFMMDEYDDLPLFAATSYFSIPHRDEKNYYGLPKVSGELYHEPRESDHSNKKLKVERGKRKCEGEQEETEVEQTPPSLFKICLTWTWQVQDGITYNVLAGERELLVFLERGLCFK